MLTRIHLYKSVSIFYCLQLGRKQDKPSSTPITHRASTYPSSHPLVAHHPTNNPRATLTPTTVHRRRLASYPRPTPTAMPPRQGSITQGTQPGPRMGLRTAIRVHRRKALLRHTQRRLRRCSRETEINNKNGSTNAGDDTGHSACKKFLLAKH